MTPIETAWLAGILEGEGHFGFQRWPSGVITPEVNLSMTDKDIIDRVRSLIGHEGLYVRQRGGHKTIYAIKVAGTAAMDVMREVLPYMGERRSLRIAEVTGLYHESRMTTCAECGNEFYWRSTGGHRPVTCSVVCHDTRRRNRYTIAQRVRRGKKKQEAAA